MNITRVYLGLGGNEGDVLSCLKEALHLLSQQKHIRAMHISHFYQTAPIQVESSSWFVNAVCSFETTLTLAEVFKITQAIEIRLGKVDKPKNASRPIDIDLLFYGHLVQRKGELEIPHPRWIERLFVLIPLKDLTSEVMLDGPLGKECYLLQEIIQPLLIKTPQAVSLLEINPSLQ